MSLILPRYIVLNDCVRTFTLRHEIIQRGIRPMFSNARRVIALALVAGLLCVIPSSSLIGVAWAGSEKNDANGEDETDGVEEQQATEPNGGLVLDEVTDEETEAEEESTLDLGPPLGLTLVGTTSLLGGILYLVDSSDLDDQSAAATDTASATALQERADRENALGITLTVLGIAMLGGSTYFWLTLDDDDEAREDLLDEQDLPTDPVSFGVTPSVSANGGSLLIHGTF